MNESILRINFCSSAPGASFKFLNDVKASDLTTEISGDKEMRPGFRFKVISLNRDGIKTFHGKELPKD